jgi:hypothetical protein
MLDNGGLSMLHSSYGAQANSSAFQAALQVGPAAPNARLAVHVRCCC